MKYEIKGHLPLVLLFKNRRFTWLSCRYEQSDYWNKLSDSWITVIIEKVMQKIDVRDSVHYLSRLQVNVSCL